MSKKTFLILSTFLVFNVSSAQYVNSGFRNSRLGYPNFKLGFRGGLNLGAIRNFEESLALAFQSINSGQSSPAQVTVPFTQSLGVRGNMGVVVNLQLSKVFSWQTELNYFQAGGDYSGSLSYNNVTVDEVLKMRINYIQIPILAKLSFGTETVKFNMFAGIAPAFALSAGLDVNASPSGSTQTSTTSQALPIGQNGISSVDFQGIIGIGFSVRAGAGDLFFDLRYNRGFKDINDNGTATQSSNYIANYNSVVGLSTGYLFYIR